MLNRSCKPTRRHRYKEFSSIIHLPLSITKTSLSVYKLLGYKILGRIKCKYHNIIIHYENTSNLYPKMVSFDESSRHSYPCYWVKTLKSIFTDKFTCFSYGRNYKYIFIHILRTAAQIADKI